MGTLFGIALACPCDSDASVDTGQDLIKTVEPKHASRKNVGSLYGIVLANQCVTTVSVYTGQDLMKTETGRRMAEQRHIFMQTYLEQFHSEWEGRA